MPDYSKIAEKPSVDYSSIAEDTQPDAPAPKKKPQEPETTTYAGTGARELALGTASGAGLPETTHASDFSIVPGLYQEFRHPIESAKLIAGSIVGGSKNELEKANEMQKIQHEAAQRGDLGGELTAGAGRLLHTAAGVVPIVGPAAVAAGEEVRGGIDKARERGKMDVESFGDVMHGVGSGLGLLLTLALGTEKGGKLAGRVINKLPAPKEVLRRMASPGDAPVKELVERTNGENAAAAEKFGKDAAKHKEETIDALHETKGREIAHERAVKVAEDSAREATAKLDAEHKAAVENSLHENQGRELAYQTELRKAKMEGEEAYQKKLSEVNEKRAKADQAYQSKVREYIKAKAKIQTDLSEARRKFQVEKAKQEKIAPTETKLKTAQSNLRAGIETAREKALKVGNDKYNAVNEKLNPSEVRPDFYASTLEQAVNSIKGSAPEPTFLSNIAKRLKANEPIRYEDLQADYSRLGRELSKGTLPGDVYHAYDQIHESIGQEMQTIADANGMGPQLTDARNYWRLMKQTFGKPFSATDAATGALKASSKDFVSAEEQANRVRLLGSFDPRLPGQFEHVNNLQKGSESLPKPVPTRELTAKVVAAHEPPPVPPTRPAPIAAPSAPSASPVTPPTRVEIPDRPAPVAPKYPEPPERVSPPDRPNEPAPKKIGTEDIRNAKGEAVKKSAEKLRGYTSRAALYITGYRSMVSISRAMMGDVSALGQLPADIAEGIAVVGGGKMMAKVLESPRVMKLLTEPTAKDLAQIPPEMRGELRPIIKAAQAKGVRVSPALIRAAGITAPTVAQPHPSDVWSGAVPEHEVR